MDLKNVHFGLVFLVNLLLTIRPANLKSVGRDCRECKPGYYASRLCSDVYDTVCKPCQPGTYTSHYNVFNTCSPCSTCEDGDFVLRECFVRSDTVCESCAAVKDNVNNDFIRRCLQADDPSDSTRLNDPSGVKLDKEDTYEPGLTSSESVATDHMTDHVIPEGSGSDVTDETIDTKYPVFYDTEEIEGSGVVPDVVDATNASVIIPDDGDEDVVTTTQTANVTTTVKEGTIEIGDGIVVANITSDTDNVVDESVQTTTEANTIHVDDNNGVVVDDEQEDDDDIEGGIIDVDVNINDEPQTGASHTQRQTETAGVSTGVVVSVVLVAALIFFILGFVVSRYWSRRQERTFNVMEAERRNGTKPPIECSGMEYKDPENNIPSKTNIYGSVPTTKQANGNTPEVKHHNPPTDGPITKSSAPITKSQPEDPTKPRAESEIRYIDEDPVEERETDALLPPTSNSSNQNKTGNQPENGSASKPDVVNSAEANNVGQEDEKTPMISKDKTHTDNS